MKKYYIAVLILAVTLTALYFSANERCKGMSFTYNTLGTTAFINWDTQSQQENLSAFSVLSWLNIGTFPTPVSTGNEMVGHKYNPSADGWSILSYKTSGGVNSVGFEHNFSTTIGIWNTPAVSTGLHHIAVTYNNTSTANVPVIYIDGVSVAVTTAQAPVGTAQTSSSALFGLYAGGAAGIGYASKQYGTIYYNRILSASEIADAYASRLAVPTYNGLVFAPMMCGTSGGVKDGNIITGSVVDIVSGVAGTPSGSPVFLADDYLIWGGK